jgi:hypothetical protein
MHWRDPTHLPEAKGTADRLLLNPHCLRASTSMTLEKWTMDKLSSRLKYALLGATMMIGTAGLALAQPAPAGAPAQTQEIKGKVAQYSLTPRGTVDGLILTDGTEVNLPPHVSTQVVFAVHPGDAVTIRGVKTGISPTVTAVAVTNDATGAVVDTGPPGPPQHLDDENRIKLQLHDPRGHLNGVLLEDGMIVRMPPPDAERHAASLAVGQPLYASGDGISGPLGKVIAAREIGPSSTKVTKIDESRFTGWMHDVFGGGDASPPPAAPPPSAAPPQPAAPPPPPAPKTP